MFPIHDPDAVMDPPDAEFVAHACNAYPKLVGIMRAWVTRVFYEGRSPSECAEKLLKELGEL